jgi:hypothetical protein
MGLKYAFPFAKLEISWRKLRVDAKRLRAVKSTFDGRDKTACRTDAKSNVMALKQAYNSRSQEPGCTATEACYD